MADPAADVGQRMSVGESPSCGHQLEEIRVPPEIALPTEIFG